MQQLTPDPSLNIHQRIRGIMSDVDYIQKGDKTVNGSYRFVSHDQVVEKLHALFVLWGVNVIPNTEDMIQDGNRTMIKYVVSFVNVDNPSDHFSTRWFAHAIDGGGTNKDGKPIPIGDKGPGKAMSYAHKYALLKTFNLATGEDPDNDANASYEPPKCVEFDSKVPADILVDPKECARLNDFIAYSANVLKKHPEDVKREACARFDQFIEAFKRWSPKKEKKS